MKRLRLIVFAACLALAVPRAVGIVLYGGDLPANLQSPASGAPWKYSVRVGEPEGSGVYLGKRFVLTANHVNTLEPVTINGKSYSQDVSFTSRRVDGEDIKLFRISGDPGLPSLPLIASTESEFSKRCTVIGWGLGRGTPVPGKGWLWNGLRVQRWGTNVTCPYILQRGTDGPRLVTAFDSGVGTSEMSLANTDSGCGLFISFDGVWKLVAIGVDVDDSAAYYDRNPTAVGYQPTRSYYVRIRPHRAAILAIINAAAP